MAPAILDQAVLGAVGLPRDLHSMQPGCALPTRPDQYPDYFPNIEWDPSLETYLERLKRLASLHEVLPRVVPREFPAAIQSPRVWRGSDFDDESEYIYDLSNSDIEEINSAVRAFIGTTTSVSAVLSRCGR